MRERLGPFGALAMLLVLPSASWAARGDSGARNIESPELWTGFLVAVFALLLLDLRVAGQRTQAQSFKSAMGWSVFWIAISVAFGTYILLHFGDEQGLEFFAGYMLEKSLSVDNLFVFVLLFSAMKIPPQHQHRVLFWGVFGALLMRGTLILAGVALVHTFHWLIAVFGVILVLTALKLIFGKETDESPVDSWLVKKVQKVLPISRELRGSVFFFRDEANGFKLTATPLFLAVVAAESADLVFALDSIPAVFAVTDDSFLVFSSNVCALLGLRALYFVVAGALAKLKYLKPGLAAILLFVGVKMLLDRWWSVPTGTSILVIAAILGVALAASLLLKDKPEAQ